MSDDPSITSAASYALERERKAVAPAQGPGDDHKTRVVFLGTGDALHVERAQTSLAVPLSADETMLIDASSGTVLLGRLEAAGIPLESVRHLFVSHRHFDHAGGLAPLLAALAALPEASLVVHAAPETLQALRSVVNLTLPGAEDWLEKRLSWHELVPGKPAVVGDTVVTPFPLDHGIECVGFRVARAGSVAVFAIDTRPSQEVVENARGADLLVHEACGLGDTAERTHTLGHSTAAEAGAVARAANVRRLILTHLRPNRFVEPGTLAAEAKSRACPTSCRLLSSPGSSVTCCTSPSLPY